MDKYTFRLVYSEIVALSLHKLFNCWNFKSSIVISWQAKRQSRAVND